MIYKTKGTCSTMIDVELKDGVIDSVKFTGGCNGNLQGISALVKGMKPEDGHQPSQGDPLRFQTYLLSRPAGSRSGRNDRKIINRLPKGIEIL